MRSLATLVMRKTVHCVTEQELISVVFVNALQTFLAENASVQRRTCPSQEILRLDADLTTQPPHSATTEEIVSVGSASATREKMLKKLCQENIASAITSHVTGTTGSFALGRTMGSASVGTASVRVSGMWKGTRHASARPAITPASHPTGNTSASSALGTGSVNVGNASVKRPRKANTQENTAKTAQLAQENAKS